MHGTTDGGLLILPEESGSELRSLMTYGYRFVVVDPQLADRRARSDRVGSPLLRRRPGDAVPVGLGHRRIAAITGHGDMMATQERLRGYHSALGAAGVLPDPQLEVESNYDVDGGREAAAALLDLEDRPTAIFAFNDPLAIGAMQAVLASGPARARRHLDRRLRRHRRG